MNPQIKEKHRKRDEDKIDELDVTSKSVLNRMLRDENKSSSNVKLEEEITDLEASIV
jgi:hypothetical protein